MDTRTPKASATWSDESLSFLTGDNACYIAQTYASYLADPNSVSFEWRQYFASLGDQEADILKDFLGPSWGAPSYSQDKTAPSPHLAGEEVSPEAVKGAILDSIRAIMLIRAYRARGHMIANLDPLNLIKKNIMLSLILKRMVLKKKIMIVRSLFMMFWAFLMQPYVKLLIVYARPIVGQSELNFFMSKILKKSYGCKNALKGKESLALPNPFMTFNGKKNLKRTHKC